MKPSHLFSDESEFRKEVYRLCARVPEGMVTTYGEIARAMGKRGARAVGNALNRNPYAPSVPCHRVVRSDGRVGGFADGTSKKTAMLKKEGLEISEGKIKDYEKKLFRLTSSS